MQPARLANLTSRAKAWLDRLSQFRKHYRHFSIVSLLVRLRSHFRDGCFPIAEEECEHMLSRHQRMPIRLSYLQLTKAPGIPFAYGSSCSVDDRKNETSISTIVLRTCTDTQGFPGAAGSRARA